MTVTAIRQDSPDRLSVLFDDGEEIKSTPGAVTALRLVNDVALNAGLLHLVIEILAYA